MPADIGASDNGLQIVEGHHASQTAGAHAQIGFLYRHPAPVGCVASETRQLLLLKVTPNELTMKCELVYCASVAVYMS